MLLMLVEALTDLRWLQRAKRSSIGNDAIHTSYMTIFLHLEFYRLHHKTGSARYTTEVSRSADRRALASTRQALVDWKRSVLLLYRTPSEHAHLQRMRTAYKNWRR